MSVAACAVSNHSRLFSCSSVARTPTGRCSVASPLPCRWRRRRPHAYIEKCITGSLRLREQPVQPQARGKLRVSVGCLLGYESPRKLPSQSLPAELASQPPIGCARRLPSLTCCTPSVCVGCFMSSIWVGPTSQQRPSIDSCAFFAANPSADPLAANKSLLCLATRAR